MNLGIVIPTLNAGATLRKTLESLSEARALGADIVIIDGGSTDDTRAIANSFGTRVEVVHGGMYAALNVGFRTVQGQWLTWINADDLLRAATAHRRLLTKTDASVLYGPVDFIDEEDRFVHSWMSARARDLLPLYRGGYSPLLQQGTLFRRAMFDDLRGFDERYRFVGDADFWWRALEAGWRFERIEWPPVAAFRLHPHQLSQRYSAEMAREHATMIDQHGGRHRTCATLMALGCFRFGNFSRYIVRFLRRRDLDGRVRLGSSYSVPLSKNTTP